MQVYLIRHPAPIEAEGVCYGREDLRVEPHALAAAAAAVRGREEGPDPAAGVRAR